MLDAFTHYAPLLAYATLFVGFIKVGYHAVKFFTSATLNFDKLTKTVEKLEQSIERVFGEQDKMRASISFLEGVQHGKESVGR